MAYWLWAAAGLAVLLAAVLLSPIRIRVRFSKVGKLDQLVLIVHALFGIVRLQTAIPAVMVRGWRVLYRESRSSELAAASSRNKSNRSIGWQTLRRYWRAYRAVLVSTRHFRTWLRATLRKVTCTRWRLDVRLGAGDAAATAVTAGIAWTLFGAAVALTSRWIQLAAHPHGEVTPNFRETELSIVWEADFRIRLAAALGAVVRLGVRTAGLGRAWRAWRALYEGPERLNRA